MTIDVGTGDGRTVLRAAAAEPTTLVLGLDANAAGMAEASRRAASPVRRGGLPNAAFVVASAECPPPELCALADVATVRFPWGSLLRGVVGLDGSVARGVAGLVGPGGTLELLLAPADRDGLDGIPTSDEALVTAAAMTFEAHGLTLLEGRRATAEEVTGSGSTWARRLLSSAGGDRSAVVIRLARPPAPGDLAVAGPAFDRQFGR